MDVQILHHHLLKRQTFLHCLAFSPLSKISCLCQYISGLYAIPFIYLSSLLPVSYHLGSVQSLSRVRLFATPWTTVRQASLSITNSQSLLKPMSIESVMPSNHLILCHPLLLLPSIFPSIGVFSNESVLHISGQSIGISASASVHPKNIQNWFPLWWTGWISLQLKGLSRVFSSTMV